LGSEPRRELQRRRLIRSAVKGIHGEARQVVD
jgi:hypothetical protein